MLAPADAHAQSLPSVDLRTWAPSADPRAGLVLEPPSSVAPSTFATSAWMHYENDSVALRAPGDGTVVSRPLENQLGLDIVGTVGLGGRSEWGFRVPVALYEQGSSGLSSSVVTPGKVASPALGDLALIGKVTVIDNDGGGFGLASIAALSIPTGAKTSFMSDGGATVALRALADFSMRFASLQASVGYLRRTTHVMWPAAGSGSATFGDELPWTLGVVLRPGRTRALERVDPGDRQAWELALHGSVPVGGAGPSGSSGAEIPFLLALSDRIGFGRYHDGFVLAGADIGLDRAVGVPTFRATVAIGWTLADHDRDGDGIPDDDDRCPTVAEDRDGFEDMDGCPEADNDGDGIVDSDDACPDVPGARSPDPRKNGCPSDPSMDRTRPPGFARDHEP